MSWVVASSLLKLRDQIDKDYPHRSKAADGTIGDAAHASRKSDHNPWVEGRVVTAIDITHDPSNGCDAEEITKALVESRDPRIKYIIWNRRIWNPSVRKTWRPYGGSNPHSRHFHLSVKSSKQRYNDTSPWQIGDMQMPSPVAEPVPNRPVLTLDDPVEPKNMELLKAQLVKYIMAQKSYTLPIERLVRVFQSSHNLHVDGKMGIYTWEELEKL